MNKNWNIPNSELATGIYTGHSQELEKTVLACKIDSLKGMSNGWTWVATSGEIPYPQGIADYYSIQSRYYSECNMTKENIWWDKYKSLTHKRCTNEQTI